MAGSIFLQGTQRSRLLTEQKQKIGPNAELYKIWWGRIRQVLTIYKEDVREKLNRVIIET